MLLGVIACKKEIVRLETIPLHETEYSVVILNECNTVHNVVSEYFDVDVSPSNYTVVTFKETYDEMKKFRVTCNGYQYKPTLNQEDKSFTIKIGTIVPC